jgi:DNA mismatch repair protein MutL
MEGVIKLLPDLVANQIAAGEVIQRPASAVKELMENAIDAGAQNIELWINDAGKKLIMVVDDGSGMSPADSRLCFERHATSKISQTDDLFKIRTLGFRGEALASIAAVAQLEMKTKREPDDLATFIRIEGGKFITQEPGSHPKGTSISVKNLFFNVPARRNFLKGNNIELKHITEEFTRVVLANESIGFRLYIDGRELYHLPPSNLKQRVVNLYGGSYNSRFVPLEQATDIVKVSGLIGKPEFARKTRGEQYFFVNGRFFKHPYLHHAVLKAYSELIAESSFPSYFIFLEVDPAQVDVNIHPTKTEVNFIENQSIYAILHTAVRSSLGRFNLTPSIEFDPEPGFNEYFSKDREIRPPSITINPDYNPFNSPTSPVDAETRSRSSHQQSQMSLLNQRGWEKLYDSPEIPVRNDEQGTLFSEDEPVEGNAHAPATGESRIFQMHNTYIVSSIKSGLLVINQQYAHQRILYERFIQEKARPEKSSRQLMFPVPITFPPDDIVALEALAEHLEGIGFSFNVREDGLVEFNALPAELPQDGLQGVIEGFIHEWNEDRAPGMQGNGTARAARLMASRLSVKTGTPLSQPEMQALVDQLFSTEHPEHTPAGKKIYVIIPRTEIEERFNQQQ